MVSFLISTNSSTLHKKICIRDWPQVILRHPSTSLPLKVASEKLKSLQFTVMKRFSSAHKWWLLSTTEIWAGSSFCYLCSQGILIVSSCKSYGFQKVGFFFFHLILPNSFVSILMANISKQRCSRNFWKAMYFWFFSSRY